MKSTLSPAVALALALAVALLMAPAQARPGGDAEYALGRQYRNGSAVRRDPVQALHHMRAAAAQGHAGAMFALSNMLMAGEGAPRDPVAARRYLEASAALDYPEALQQLALHIQDGSLGFARDPQHAAQLMRAMEHAMKHRLHEAHGADAEAGHGH